MAHAQQEPPPQPTPLFRAVANVVRVDTLVTERGKPVGKLTADDFELFDDGVRQQVTAASIEDVDIDVVLVLDTSRSVAGTRLQALRDAASALVRNLRPDDRAAVVTFASGVTVNAPLTSDHTAVSRALETADARGATSLVDAAWTSVLLAHGNDRPTLVLIFSDGADTASWLRVSPVVALASRANLVVDAVVAGGARLLRQPRRSAPPTAAVGVRQRAARRRHRELPRRPHRRHRRLGRSTAPADRGSRARSSPRCASSAPATSSVTRRPASIVPAGIPSRCGCAARVQRSARARGIRNSFRDRSYMAAPDSLPSSG